MQKEQPEVYAEYFAVDVVKADPIPPSYNVAPTDQVYAIAEHDDTRQLGTFAWGLLPWWAKDAKMAAKHINARVETVADKAAFRESFKEKRCIIPADGFYEWERLEKGKLPHYIYSTSGEPLALAGLWSSWRDPETDERRRTCTIITGEPTDLVSKLHNRMPVILPKGSWGAWLDPSIEEPGTLTTLLRSLSEPDLTEHPVSTLVNKVQNNVPELIDRLESGAVDS